VIAAAGPHVARVLAIEGDAHPDRAGDFELAAGRIVAHRAELDRHDAQIAPDHRLAERDRLSRGIAGGEIGVRVEDQRPRFSRLHGRQAVPRQLRLLDAGHLDPHSGAVRDADQAVKVAPSGRLQRLEAAILDGEQIVGATRDLDPRLAQAGRSNSSVKPRVLSSETRRTGRASAGDSPPGRHERDRSGGIDPGRQLIRAPLRNGKQEGGGHKGENAPAEHGQTPPGEAEDAGFGQGAQEVSGSDVRPRCIPRSPLLVWRTVGARGPAGSTLSENIHCR